LPATLSPKGARAERQQAIEIVRRKEACNWPWIRNSHFPEVAVAAIAHESEWRKRLALGNFSHVVPELFIAIARVAGTPFGFNHRDDISGCVVKAIIRDAVPRFMVIAIHRNFQSNSRPVVGVPSGGTQRGVDKQCPRGSFGSWSHSHRMGIFRCAASRIR